MKNKLTLAFDIDGTICTIDKAIEVFNRETGKSVTPDTMYAYEFKKVFDLPIDKEVAIWEKHSEEIIIESDIHVKLVNYLKDYYEKGADIVLVTARFSKYRDVTEKWLSKFDIPYTKLFMNETDKYQTLKNEKVNRFFDDKGSLIENLLKTDISDACELTIVDSKYNQQFKAHSRFYP